MPGNLHALLRRSDFIPLVYNYCDRWCRHCPVTGQCLVFAAEELLRSSTTTDPSPSASPVAAGGQDVDQEQAAHGHPLHYLARHYARQARAYLDSLGGLPLPSTPPSPLEVIAWFSPFIGAKIHRALCSQRRAAADPLYMDDCLGSAKVALLAIERSLDAWRSIAPLDDDPRVQGVMELLEALGTGAEIRFPAARAFQRPGLDAPVTARASESDDSDEECAGGDP